MPPRVDSPATEQTADAIAAAIEEYLADNPRALVLDEGRPIFDMRSAKFTLSTEHGRCTLHLWDAEKNIVRRVSAAVMRHAVLRLSTLRFGQAKPQIVEITPDTDRRTPSTREATRVKYLAVLKRVLSKQFPEWRVEALRTAMDLEKSFGPAYARGLMVQGTRAWAVIAVNAEESQATVDGILTLGILWLHHCRESSGGRRLVHGLRVIAPRGRAGLTFSRMAWLNQVAAQWELWEIDESSEDLFVCDTGDFGNLTTHLLHAPNESAARERFGDAASRVLAVVPDAMRSLVEQRVLSGRELAFLLHGLEFARARLGYAGESFNSVEQITFGAGQQETPLTADNAAVLHDLVASLFARRRAGGDRRDALFRMQPERWLENSLRRDVRLLDDKLDRTHVYTQVPAFSAADRGMLDLLAVDQNGRLAVLELKADEDLQLALQGLDYWVRVRWHHLQRENHATGLGEFQSHGYFPGLRLAPQSPRLYLVAPALRIHPATETVLRHLSAEVDWTLLALDERWRSQIKVVWRKRSSGDQHLCT